MIIKKLPLFVILMAYILWAIIFVHNNSLTGLNGDRPFFALFDDAMISMRYAENLVAGNGLVWNPGEYVEGYTNPLWTLVMATEIFVAGKHIAPLIVQLTGLILLLGAACAVYGSAQLLAKNRGAHPQYAAVLATVLFLLYYPNSYWSLTGMEVSALIFLFSLAVYFTINDQRSTINDQRSTINDQRSTINDQRSTINDQRSTY